MPFVRLSGDDSHPSKNNVEEEERIDSKDLALGPNAVFHEAQAGPHRPCAGGQHEAGAEPHSCPPPYRHARKHDRGNHDREDRIPHHAHRLEKRATIEKEREREQWVQGQPLGQIESKNAKGRRNKHFATQQDDVKGDENSPDPDKDKDHRKDNGRLWRRRCNA